MAKQYWLKFGSGSPTPFTGLTPTFTIFSAAGLTSLAAPGITEMPSGSGLYSFQYAPTLSIIFTADGGSALSSSDRYITGVLDPIQTVDQKVGTIDDSYGTDSADPTTLMGFAKRSEEFWEGNATFNKSTGAWSIYSRGSSTLLREKDLANNVTQATKT